MPRLPGSSGSFFMFPLEHQKALGFEISVLVGVASRRFGVENSSWDYSGITTNVTFL